MNPGLLMMSARRAIQRCKRPQPYRGALLHGASWYFESVVLAILWTGILLCGYLACQQIHHFYEENRQRHPSNPLQKPLQTFRTSTAPKQPANDLPLWQDINVDGEQSLFRFRKAETKAPPPENPPQEAAHAATEGATQIKANPHVWQLEVQRWSEGNMAQQLANAKYQLRSGYVDLARQSFEQILQLDPHHVVALAGMLVVMSQRGDLYQREDYLRRLRQEIPDYVPDESVFLLQVAD